MRLVFSLLAFWAVLLSGIAYGTAYRNIGCADGEPGQSLRRFTQGKLCFAVTAVEQDQELKCVVNDDAEEDESHHLPVHNYAAPSGVMVTPPAFTYAFILKQLSNCYSVAPAVVGQVADICILQGTLRI